MGKKSKKNRFNKTVDVDVVYSNNTIADVDPADNMAELNLTKEKAEELQKIRAKLPSFSHGSSLENELAKLPTVKPFRAFVHNMAFSATEDDIAKFFEPLEITNINLVSGETGSRGFCFVDFATREDLAKALSKNDSPLAGRPINVRIADPNTNDRGGSSFGRDRNAFGGGPRRSEMSFGRNRGGYRPAALRDEFPEPNSGGTGEWSRGAIVGRSAEPKPFGGGFNRSGDSRPSFQPNQERFKLNILPRTAPITTPSSEPIRDPKIFGAAKPVDTATKDKVIGERLNQSAAGVH